MSSYPKIYSVGHKYLEYLFTEPVLIEEKVDGSQFSFGKTLEGKVFYRSKGRELFRPVEDKLFKAACEYVDSVESRLRLGYAYRGEVLAKPKHNCLAYDRIPRHNVVIFDVDTADESYVNYEKKVELAGELDLETVPRLFQGEVYQLNALKAYLDTVSFLGGTKVEGIVIKNYARFGIDKKTVMGKWVREEFKEIAGGEWRKEHPTALDVVAELVKTYKTPARWEKAIQHLREAGTLTGELQDIGPLMKEIIQDTKLECGEEIKEKLFAHFWSKVARSLTGGFPEYYKEKVAVAPKFTPDKELEKQAMIDTWESTNNPINE